MPSDILPQSPSLKNPSVVFGDCESRLRSSSLFSETLPAPPSTRRPEQYVLGKFYKIVISFLFCSILLSVGSIVSAAGLQDSIIGPGSETKNFFDSLGINPSTAKNPGAIVVAVFNIATGFIGIIMVVIISNAGIGWMTAGGDEEKTKKATQTIRNGVIGLTILLMSWSVAYFVLIKLVNAVWNMSS